MRSFKSDVNHKTEHICVQIIINKSLIFNTGQNNTLTNNLSFNKMQSFKSDANHTTEHIVAQIMFHKSTK